MDTDNAPEIVFADGLAPSGAPLASPPPVRWRQRAVGRSRAVPAGAPAAPRRLITLPHTSRSAAPNAAGRHVADSDTSCDPTQVGDASAQSGAHGDPRQPRHARAMRHAGPRGTTDDTGVQPDTAGVPHITDAISIGEPAGTRDRVDGDDAAQRADLPAETVPEPDAASSLAPDDAAVAAGTDPQRAPRDIELWLLARRAQGAALRLDFELCTAPARQVFRRDFVYVSRQLHALEASRRVQGLDRARLNEALNTLRRRADAIQAFMEHRAAELQAAIATRGPASAHIAFTRPARFQATIVSPGAHRFLALLMKADETLAVLETAWLLGLVEPATRAALVSDCRRALLGFKDLACDLRRAVGLLVQDIHAQRREEPAAAPGDLEAGRRASGRPTPELEPS